MQPTASDPDYPPGFIRTTGRQAPKLRLVVVEDDWRTHSALRRVFTALGWEVESAMTVAGGLALLEGDPNGLIIDLKLPDGDGLDILRRVRLQGLRARVVVATGVDDPDQIAAIRRLRPDALVRKPVELDAVIRALGGEEPA